MADIFELFKQIEKKESNDLKPIEYIVAGLGNPGDKYASTRHNMGFICLEFMAEKYNIKFDKLKFNAFCGEALINGRRVLFVKPQTFMNNSGEAVGAIADFYKIPPEKVVIIYDDIAINPGSMRVKRKGSDGGHNGIKSIIYHLRSQDFPRIKIGVGSPASSDEMINWVLGIPKPEDREDIARCIKASVPALELILDGKIDVAMNSYNGVIPKD